MPTLKTHTAPGQALGYFFQLERALSWIAKSPIGSIIGIETEDDVVVALSNGHMIYEQDKSSTSNNFPFDTNRIDFWKTLLIWLDGLNNKEINCVEPHPVFYMVTNKTATNQLVVDIGRAQSQAEIELIINKIKNISASVPNNIKDVVNRVLNYNDKQLSYLIEHIKFIDGKESNNKQTLISDLQLPNDDTDYYINALTGYIFNLTVEAWKEKKPALISRDDFMRLKNKLLVDHFTDFFNEETIKVADIAIENEKHNENNYIKQLSIINSDDDDITTAIADYLKSSEARTVMAKKGFINEQSLVTVFNELERRWKGISKSTKRLQIPYRWSDIDVGQETYTQTINFKTEINGLPTRNYYLTAGMYHMLSNDLRVGWHPNYKNIMNINTKNNEDS